MCVWRSKETNVFEPIEPFHPRLLKDSWPLPILRSPPEFRPAHSRPREFRPWLIQYAWHVSGHSTEREGAGHEAGEAGQFQDLKKGSFIPHGHSLLPC